MTFPSSSAAKVTTVAASSLNYCVLIGNNKLLKQQDISKPIAVILSPCISSENNETITKSLFEFVPCSALKNTLKFPLSASTNATTNTTTTTALDIENEVLIHPIIAELHQYLFPLSFHDSLTNELGIKKHQPKNKNLEEGECNEVVFIKCVNNNEKIQYGYFTLQEIKVNQEKEEILTIESLYWFVDETTTTTTEMEMIKQVKESLVGRLVSVNTILFTEISLNMENVLIILKINKIDQSSVPNYSSREDCYRLGLADSFELKLSRQTNEGEKSENIEIFEKIECPGYEFILNELLSLYSIENSLAAPSAVLLTGSRGVGKTHMAKAFISRIENGSILTKFISGQELSNSSLLLSMDELISNVILPTRILSSVEKKIVLIIDDIDILIKGEEEGEHKKETTALSAFFKATQILHKNQKPCFVLGICQVVSSSNTLSLRVNQFEKKIHISPPSEQQRFQILNYLLSENEYWSRILATYTPGFVASDLCLLVKNAYLNSKIRSGSSQDEESILIWDDLKNAARSCIPSQLSMFNVSSSSSSSSSISTSEEGKYQQAWKRFGGYHDMKLRIQRAILNPWKRFLSSSRKHKSNYSNKIPPPAGVIFHGPSGVGKSIAASCLCSCLGFQVVKVKSSDVLSKWQGGSEEAIRILFARARTASPCILFFDDIDGITTNRSNDASAESDVHARILSTMLNEIDGVDTNIEIFIVATTNRLHAVDAALLRPGRIQEHIELGLPNEQDCLDILEVYLNKVTLHENVDLSILAKTMVSNNKTGADIEGICREACYCAMSRGMGTNVELIMEDFENSMSIA